MFGATREQICMRAVKTDGEPPTARAVDDVLYPEKGGA